MHTHYTYRVTNTLTNEFFLGKRTTSDPAKRYMGSGPAIQDAIKTYGGKNFSLEILSHYDSKEEMIQAFHILLTEDTLSNPLCLNTQHAGRTLTKLNSPGRERQSTLTSGDLSSAKRPEVRDKMASAKQGELNPNSAFSDIERAEIVQAFKNGCSRAELHKRYADRVTSVTINRIIRAGK